MGILANIGDALKKVDHRFSNDPEIVGKRFEDHVENLFPLNNYKLLEKTHSFDTNKERYVESSLNPDFIFQHIPTGDRFAVECKYRTQLNSKGQLEWSDPDQLKRYQTFQYRRKIPVYVVIGYKKITKKWNKYEREYDEHVERFMYNIPLNEAKYPTLYKSVFSKFERDYNGKFFWNDGKLY
jgi:hypothetical protein